MPHHPNPFYFVPFQESASLIEADRFAGEPTLTGYLEVEITPLTPVHVIGRVEPVVGAEGRRIKASHFDRQDGEAVIPGSSIRGMLRSFVEALTNGWVTEVTPEYTKVFKGRHLGFSAFEPTPGDKPGRETRGPAIPPAYRPDLTGGKIDIASLLFGIVTEGSSAAQSVARRGCVIVEDALFSPDLLEANGGVMPDVDGGATLGGPHPSASTWWYMEPHTVWNRVARITLRDGNERTLQSAEYVGERYRGRKYYFHQNPGACVKHYLPGGDWANAATKITTYGYGAETLSSSTTVGFRMYVTRIPEPLLNLLLFALMPGSKIRHKIGAGQAFGYGSIDVRVVGAHLRGDGIGIPGQLVDQTERFVRSRSSEASDELVRCGLANLVDEDALLSLAQILTWPPAEGAVYVYPSYAPKQFQQVVTYAEFERAVEKRGLRPSPAGLKVDRERARLVASALWETKRTIDLELYQSRADGWSDIAARTP